MQCRNPRAKRRKTKRISATNDRYHDMMHASVSPSPPSRITALRGNPPPASSSRTNICRASNCTRARESVCFRARKKNSISQCKLVFSQLPLTPTRLLRRRMPGTRFCRTIDCASEILRDLPDSSFFVDVGQKIFGVASMPFAIGKKSGSQQPHIQQRMSALNTHPTQQ
jgi:hypothetical protein